MIFESQKLYYIEFTYKYCKLTLFLALIFSPDWPEPGFIRAKLSPNRGKRGFQDPRVILRSFYV